MWVFGYGSLMWNPGFVPRQAVPARLSGWRRSFCMRSVHYRGTAACPGLVLALDREGGAACDGLALRVAPDEEAAVLAALRERELVSSAYLETRLVIGLADGRRIEALTYVVDPAHPQYCRIPPEEQARMIATATGERGSNADYLANTALHLAALGLADPELDRLWARVQAIRGGAGPEGT
ncbi:MAG: gamma-glutamylcyclotransferase [Rubellimicrobium sp.]|nr:gamma-glutamylcyclotransferase [Rubellimicrobium sp.]